MLNIVGKTIAIDICNTIADVIGEINIRLGHNPNPNEYFHPGLKDKPNYFEDNLDVFLKAKPIGNSATILKELSKNNTIIYITARPQIAEFVTKSWLNNNGYPKGKIYFTNNKVEIASRLNVDLAIEDAPFELERYIKAGFDILVKQQSYNMNFPNRFEWEDLIKMKGVNSLWI